MIIITSPLSFFPFKFLDISSQLLKSYISTFHEVFIIKEKIIKNEKNCMVEVLTLVLYMLERQLYKHIVLQHLRNTL